MSIRGASAGITVKLCALLLLAVTLCGFFYILKMRFEAGDAMPRGSSLRSDPLGIEVLYESLNKSGLMVAERNHTTLPYSHLDNYDMLVFSHGGFGMSKMDSDAVNNFVTNHGGRLLISFEPRKRYSDKRENSWMVKSKKEVEGDEEVEGVEEVERVEEVEGVEEVERVEEVEGIEEGEGDEEVDQGCSHGCCLSSCSDISSNSLWYGITFDKIDDPDQEATLADQDLAAVYGLPGTLAVKTTMAFATNICEAGWVIIYRCGDKPVIIQKAFEKGSVILSTLSYPFSNEAMRSMRETKFLLWVFKDCSRVLFDESHFGLINRRTVAKLFRSHKLHYAFWVMIIPVGLYFWLTAIPLIPRYANDDIIRCEENGEEGGALCNLLQRAISQKDIVPSALEGWTKNNSVRLQRMPGDKREAFDALLEKNRKRARKLPREQEIVDAYNEVVALLKIDD